MKFIAKKWILTISLPIVLLAMLFLSQNLNAGNADSQCQQDAKSMCVAEPGMVCCFWYSDSEKFCMVDEYDFKDEDDDEDEGENNDIPR